MSLEYTWADRNTQTNTGGSWVNMKGIEACRVVSRSKLPHCHNLDPTHVFADEGWIFPPKRI